MSIEDDFDNGAERKRNEQYLAPVINPLSKPLPIWTELLNRIKLLDWWVKYHKGETYESALNNRIIQLGTEMGFQDRWLKKILRHAISEFSKKGLGPDYYGYHNIDHELEAALFALVAANGLPRNSSFTDKELAYLFVAALFHDYDPLKRFDKPHEDAIEQIIRTDVKIRRFIDEVGLNIDIVIALIHRTAYPFQGDIAEHAQSRMAELFSAAGIPEDDHVARKRYSDLGWFLSISERMAGYALGDFEHSKDLARRNAHALGWHPSVINERSVRYFAALNGEGEMFDLVMSGVPERYKRSFLNNVEAFREAWNQELRLKGRARTQEAIMVTLVERNDASVGMKLSSEVIESVMEIYHEQPLPMRSAREVFLASILDPETILVILRAGKPDGDIVGYAKGMPLEKCKLRRGTTDNNFGKNNTAYLEGVCVKRGYLGATGGHLLRLRFFDEAAKRGCNFVTGYAHRDVISQRNKKGEKIDIVQMYDPDKLDYYRANLADEVYRMILADSNTMYVGQE